MALKHLAASTHFRKQLKKLPQRDQERATATLKGFLAALRMETVPAGYGLKKLNGDKYEIRVGLKIRIVMKAEGDTLVCHVIGDHEDVRRYLRAYRAKWSPPRMRGAPLQNHGVPSPLPRGAEPRTVPPQAGLVRG